MTTDNCVARKLIEEKIKSINSQNEVDAELSAKTREEWKQKLEKDFCCVSYKYTPLVWSWYHLCEVYNRNKNEKIGQPTVSFFWNDHVTKGLHITFPGITRSKWHDYVLESKSDKGWYSSDPIRFSIHFCKYKVTWKNEEISYDNFLTTLCSELAEYTSSYELGYNPRA